MPDGRRKSIQPMAELLLDGTMQVLQQLSPRDPLPMWRRIAERLCGAIRPEAWVAQYCGALGKRANR